MTGLSIEQSQIKERSEEARMNLMHGPKETFAPYASA